MKKAAAFGLTLFLAALVGASCAPNVKTVDCAVEPTSPACLSKGGAAKLQVDPPFGLGFGCITLGCDEVQILTVSNHGEASLFLSQLRLSIGTSSDFTATLWQKDSGPEGGMSEIPLPTLEKPLRIDADRSAELHVRYRPSDGHPDTGIVWLDWDKGNRTEGGHDISHYEFDLRARVLGAAKAESDVTSVNFGHVPLGEQREMLVHITNVSPLDAVLEVTGATLVDDSDPAYTVGMGWTATANPGASIALPIVLTPNAEAVFLGTLRITTNAPDLASFDIALRGLSTSDPRLIITEPEDAVLAFGTLRVDSLPLRRVVEVVNQSATSVVLSTAITGSGAAAFKVLPPAEGEPPLEQPLEPLDERTLWIEALPLQSGPFEATLFLGSQNGDVSAPPLPLGVVGIAPEGTVSPASVSLGRPALGWTTLPQRVTVRNVGTGPLVVERISLLAGSSDQIELIDRPVLPASLNPNETLSFAAMLRAGSAGPANGTIVVQTNGVAHPVLSVAVTGQILECTAACPVANGRPSCAGNVCSVESCSPGYHNTDNAVSNGCECRQDLYGVDVGGNCTAGFMVQPVGDLCTDLPASRTFTGNLHSQQDLDVYFVQTRDAGGLDKLGCDLSGDSYRGRVTLESGPTGLVLCARVNSAGSGCSGWTSTYHPSYCGQSFYGNSGVVGQSDNRDITAWVMWHPDATPTCGTYTLVFSGR